MGKWGMCVHGNFFSHGKRQKNSFFLHGDTRDALQRQSNVSPRRDERSGDGDGERDAGG